jgi:hypothetical protein
MRISASAFAGRDRGPVSSGGDGSSRNELLETSGNRKSGWSPAGTQMRVRLKNSPEIGTDWHGLLEEGRVDLDLAISGIKSVGATTSDFKTSSYQLLENTLDGGGQVNGTKFVNKPVDKNTFFNYFVNC